LSAPHQIYRFIMLQPQFTRHPLVKGFVALLLTFAAGGVDVIGFITLYHIFTAHMTGTTVHLGQDAALAHWPEAVKSFAVVVAFLMGSIFGRTLIEIGSRRQIRSVATITLLTEAALIAAVVLLGEERHAASTILLPAMLAAAMGTQTATLTRVGPLTVHTTFVTGMLNKLAQLLSRVAFLADDRWQHRPVFDHLQRALRQAGFMFSIWMFYLLGAIAGTWLNSVLQIKALLIPVAIVLVAVVVDRFTPLSIAEEHEEPER